MSASMGLQTDIGLRHLIQDAVSILRGVQVEAARRTYVLSDLQDIFAKVARGQDLVQGGSLFMGSLDRGAFEAYSELDRIVPQVTAGDLGSKIKLTADRFAALKAGARIPEEQRTELEAVLVSILSSLERHNSSGLPSEPEQLSFSR